MIVKYVKTDKILTTVDQVADAKWIHISPPFDNDSFEQLAEAYNIPIDYFTDSLDIDERSRYEKEDDVTFVLINSPMINVQNKEGEAIYITVPIGMIIVEDFIITICSRNNPIIDRFLEGRVKNFDPKNRSRFVLQIFEQNVLSFLDSLKKLNLRRNLIEQELYNSSRSKELKELLRIEKSLVYFVNSLNANELLKLKIKRVDLLKIRNNEFLSDLFEDIIIDNGQALEMSNVYTNILSGTMEAYASIVSNNMNLFIQRLTIVTIVLMVPTLVASFYGMNIKYLPFSQSPYALLVIVLISVVLGLFLVWISKQKRFF